MTAQVNADGCLALYKSLPDDSCEGSPGVAPACCKNVALHELGQLMVQLSGQLSGAQQNVDIGKVVAEWVDTPKLEVPPENEGIKVTGGCK